MTDELWDNLAERVAMSRFAGVTSVDDDILDATDLSEGAINPHQRAGGAGAGASPPAMMMPPMMMGGMGRGGAQGGGGGGMGGTSSLGTAAPVPASGPVASGYDPLMAAPEAAGVASAGVGDAGAADAPTDGDGGPAIGGTGGASGGGGGGGSEVGASGGDAPPDAGAGGGESAASTPTDGARHDGFSFDPEVLKKLADTWTGLAQDFPAMPAPGELSMGLLTGSERPRQALNQQLSLWAAGAAREFEEIAARLRDTDTAYQDVDDEGAAQIRKATS